MRKLCLFVLAIVSLVAVEYDQETGLKIAEGLEEVKTNCTVCHSSRFIIQSRLDRQGWLSTIRWMQETQGLWEFDPKTEDIILNYLSTQYPQIGTSRRRLPLKEGLMPPSK